MLELLIDPIGWAGAVALLGAYAMVSTKRWPGSSFRYQGLNLLGASAVLANSAYHGALPSVLLNALWAAIAVVTLWVVARRRRRQA